MSTEPRPDEMVGDPTEDLYCLGCGYNLRGLPGDPRRCPECGQFSTLEEMRWPAAIINKQVKRFETWPALIVGSFFFGFFLWVFLLVVLYESGYGESASARISIIPAVLVGLACWVGSFLVFRKQAEPGSPWLLVVIQMHVASVLILIGFGGTCSMCATVPMVFFSGNYSAIAYSLLGALGWVPGYWLYRVSRKNLVKVRLAKVRELARMEMQLRNHKKH